MPIQIRLATADPPAHLRRYVALAPAGLAGEPGEEYAIYVTTAWEHGMS